VLLLYSNSLLSLSRLNRDVSYLKKFAARRFHKTFDEMPAGFVSFISFIHIEEVLFELRQNLVKFLFLAYGKIGEQVSLVYEPMVVDQSLRAL